MDTKTIDPGYFVLSLDTELGWGYYDHDRVRTSLFSPDGSRERQAIVRLLDLFDEFQIAATWACVGHIFYERCENCAICPVLDWKGRYGSFDEIVGTDHPLWYGADVIRTLLSRGARHEIGFHGYTHKVFDEDTMSEGEARIELLEWLRMAKRQNIVPRTVVFPRNRVGYLALFKKFGFLCYRGAEPASLSGMSNLLEKIRRRLPFVFTPPVFDLPTVGPRGLVNIPASPNYFQPARGLQRLLDTLNLTTVSMSGAIRGVRRAAEEGKIVHVWSHPCDFRTEKDWAKLRYLLSHVAGQVRLGKLRCITMGDLAMKTRHLNEAQ